MDRDHRLGIALVSASAVPFAAAGIFTRLIAADVWTVLVWRAVIGGLLIWIYARRQESGVAMGWRGWMLALVGGAASIVFLAAFRMTYVANVTLIYAMAPFAAAGLDRVIRGERVRPEVLRAALFSVAGVGVIVAGGLGGVKVTGDLLAVAMMGLFALYTVLIRAFPGAPVLTVSAVRDVDRKAAQRGFLVLLVHVAAGLAHGLDAGIQADQMLAVAAQDSEAAETALIAPSPLRSMQGTCTRPFTGSQVMPRWCSSAISAAFSTCSGVPPRTAARPGRGHGGGGADFGLTAAFRARDRGVVLAQGRRWPRRSAGSRRPWRARRPAHGPASSGSRRAATPAAPLVGAVTTWPPAAFSSFTAMA
jgi:hypothetical protein